jgi:hypothetical protein
MRSPRLLGLRLIGRSHHWQSKTLHTAVQMIQWKGPSTLIRTKPASFPNQCFPAFPACQGNRVVLARALQRQRHATPRRNAERRQQRHRAGPPAVSKQLGRHRLHHVDLTITGQHCAGPARTAEALRKPICNRLAHRSPQRRSMGELGNWVDGQTNPSSECR